MVCARTDDAHRNEVPTPPPAGRAGTENRSLACDLARRLGQAADLLRGHGGPIEEVIGLSHGCDRRGRTPPAELTCQGSSIATTNTKPAGALRRERTTCGKSGLDRVAPVARRLFGGHDLQAHFLLQWSGETTGKFYAACYLLYCPEHADAHRLRTFKRLKVLPNVASAAWRRVGTVRAATFTEDEGRALSADA
jgi:hypothetical protein